MDLGELFLMKCYRLTSFVEYKEPGARGALIYAADKASFCTGHCSHYVVHKWADSRSRRRVRTCGRFDLRSA